MCIASEVGNRELKAMLSRLPRKANPLPAGSTRTVRVYGTVRCHPGTHYAPPVMTVRGAHELPQCLRFQSAYINALKDLHPPADLMASLRSLFAVHACVRACDDMFLCTGSRCTTRTSAESRDG